MEIIEWVWGPDRGLTSKNARLSTIGRGEPGQRTVYCQRLILNRNCLTVSNPNPEYQLHSIQLLHGASKLHSLQ